MLPTSSRRAYPLFLALKNFKAHAQLGSRYILYFMLLEACGLASMLYQLINTYIYVV